MGKKEKRSSENLLDFTAFFLTYNEAITSKTAALGNMDPNCIFIARKIAAVITLHISGLF